VPLTLDAPHRWEVRRIGVVGPGIVGMPMAALLANAGVREGRDAPAPVVVVQRPSPTSGWKVRAINEGRSTIRGIEPELDGLVRRGVASGLLFATHDVAALRDADVVLICVQTDKDGINPDYGPLFDAIDAVALVLGHRPSGNLPLIIIESTLAPSSMSTVIRSRFARHGLEDGRDVLLGNSPNRVMPGHLVQRVAESDKIIGALRPSTVDLIRRLYARIVTRGTLHPTNSLTAEIVKTVENAYRDVRIALSTEIARWCDERDIDFHDLRQRANEIIGQTDGASRDADGAPTGGLLLPTVGVGGHCLPKDGILLWWRLLEAGHDTSRSVILEARRVNDESPSRTIELGERRVGPLKDRRVAVVGTAYRADSGDTRNAPALALARAARHCGASVILHDPFVDDDDWHLSRAGLASNFTRDLDAALSGAEIAFLCTKHGAYVDNVDRILAAPSLVGIVDACNLLPRGTATHTEGHTRITGIGWGRISADANLVEDVVRCFRATATGVANEVQNVCEFLDGRYAPDSFNRVALSEVQQLARTCVTGCDIVDPGTVASREAFRTFRSRVVERAGARSDSCSVGLCADGVTAHSP
jgi:UDP-N-acetyl-D-mannosaminuronic acid dehydrogenase